MSRSPNKTSAGAVALPNIFAAPPRALLVPSGQSVFDERAACAGEELDGLETLRSHGGLALRRITWAAIGAIAVVAAVLLVAAREQPAAVRQVPSPRVIERPVPRPQTVPRPRPTRTFHRRPERGHEGRRRPKQRPRVSKAIRPSPAPARPPRPRVPSVPRPQPKRVPSGSPPEFM